MSTRNEYPTTIQSADGTPLALWHLGGEGPPLLFVHATGFCAQVWEPMAHAMSGTHSCWALDVRGHGYSATASPDEHLDQDWERVGEDVAAAMEHIGGDIIGVGHSMGGAGLVLASAIVAPNIARIRGMWLFEPIIFPPEFRTDPDEDTPLSAGAMRRRADFSDVESAFDNFAAKPPMSTLAPECLRAYVEHGFRPDGDHITLRCRPAIEAAFYRRGAHHRGWDVSASVTIPTAIVVGAEVPMGPAMVAPRLADRIPGAHLVEMRHLGHFGPLEAPGACAEAVSGFIETLR